MTSRTVASQSSIDRPGIPHYWPDYIYSASMGLRRWAMMRASSLCSVFSREMGL